jgi:hydroxyacylglutathione hydrolase
MYQQQNLKIEKFVFNDFEQNTYLVYSEKSKEAIIIDPGNSNAFEDDELERFIREQNLRLTKIINTHGHIDHIFGIAFLKEHFNPDFYFPSPDLPLLLNVRLQSEMIGIPTPKVVQPDFDLHQFETFQIDDFTIEVIKTPGHSPGGTSVFIKELKKIFTGDTIFFESIGRTDLWGGDEKLLLDSIQSKIFTLDDDIEILPGHGPSTTVGHEKKYNPFLK